MKLKHFCLLIFILCGIGDALLMFEVLQKDFSNLSDELRRACALGMVIFSYIAGVMWSHFWRLLTEQ